MKFIIILILAFFCTSVYSSVSDCYTIATRNSQYCKLLSSKGYFDIQSYIKAEFDRGGPRKNKEGKSVLPLPKLQPSTIQAIYPVIVAEYLKHGIEIKHGAVLDQPTNTLVLCIDSPCAENTQQRVPRPAPVEQLADEEEEGEGEKEVEIKKEEKEEVKITPK